MLYSARAVVHVDARAGEIGDAFVREQIAERALGAVADARAELALVVDAVVLAAQVERRGQGGTRARYVGKQMVALIG